MSLKQFVTDHVLSGKLMIPTVSFMHDDNEVAPRCIYGGTQPLLGYFPHSKEAAVRMCKLLEGLKKKNIVKEAMVTSDGLGYVSLAGEKFVMLATVNEALQPAEDAVYFDGREYISAAMACYNAAGTVIGDLNDTDILDQVDYEVEMAKFSEVPLPSLPDVAMEL